MAPDDLARRVQLKSEIGENETANRFSGAGAFLSSSSSASLTRLVFAERFDLVRELGSGGMGRVLQAFDHKMQREVAVKRLRNPTSANHELLERFVREAQLAGRLNHAHIMTVHDVFIDDEGPYLVLEYIDGESLADRLQRERIPWPAAIDLLLPICEAIAYAHEEGVIHRDIKPANIFVSRKGIQKLGDFGIARLLEDQGLTLSGVSLGTPGYAAPEQMSSAATADVRADVYSLAATLYHMVAGESPQQISPDKLPVELRSIVCNATDFRPDNRPASVLEFSKGLKDIRKTGRIRESKPQGPSMTSAEAKTMVVPFSRQDAQRAQAIWARQLGLPIEFINTAIQMKFRLIPPGGLCGASDSNAPCLSTEQLHGQSELRPFYCGVFPVTQWQFKKVMNCNPSHFSRTGAGKENLGKFAADDFPVEQVSVDQIQRFLGRLTEGEANSHGRYRLMTALEWEFACRAGMKTLYYFGPELNSSQANFRGPNDVACRPFPVDTYSKWGNSFGLYDMLGSVWEIVSGDMLSDEYICCGGSWNEPASNCQCDSRRLLSALINDNKLNEVGFRVACDIETALAVLSPRHE